MGLGRGQKRSVADDAEDAKKLKMFWSDDVCSDDGKKSDVWADEVAQEDFLDYGFTKSRLEKVLQSREIDDTQTVLFREANASIATWATKAKSAAAPKKAACSWVGHDDGLGRTTVCQIPQPIPQEDWKRCMEAEVNRRGFVWYSIFPTGVEVAPRLGCSPSPHSTPLPPSH